MKETRNVPQLRFSGFDDEWEEKNFSDITYISATKNKSNLPLESYSITNENGFIPQDEQFENGGTMKDADKRMYWIVPPKSFGYNPARINVGSIGYYDGKKDVIVSSLYEIFKMTENCDDAFFWQWFKSDNLQKQVLKLQEGGVRLYFYYDKLCMGEIKIPSKGEQQKIGSLLSNLDSLIQAKAKKLKSLKAVKKSLLQKCFPKAGEKVPEMRFAGFSGDWEEKKLTDEVELYSGLTYTPKDVEEYGTLVLRSSNVQNGEIELEDNVFVDPKVVNSKNVEKGDIIVVVRNGSRALIGKHAQIKTTMHNTVIGAFMTGIKAPNPEFMNALLSTDAFTREVEINLGATINQITNSTFESMSFYFPKTIEEQQALGSFFSKYDSLVSAQQKEIDKLKDIKKSLLQKMFV